MEQKLYLVTGHFLSPGRGERDSVDFLLSHDKIHLVPSRALRYSHDPPSLTVNFL